MTQIRKWLFAALTALMVAVPLATAPTARPDLPEELGHTQGYYIYLRANANDE
jgi:hypothetical protein